MYWNPHNHSSMESLLDKHDTKLETLLSIDNIILQVKNGDKKLISFLSQPDHLMKLFSYAIATNLPEDKAIKYPYVACEIICADNGRFIEAMRRNTNILSPLWSFLTEMKPRRITSHSVINNSVTGDSPSAIQNGAIFFSRLNIFLSSKMLPTMIHFLNENVPNAIDLLLNNLDLQPIAELLYRFYAISSNDSGSDSVDILGWLKRGKFYEKLSDRLSPSKGSDLHFSVSQFISGLFSLPFPETFPREQIMKPFLNSAWLNRLLSNIFGGMEDSDNTEESEFIKESESESEESSIINGLEIISSLLKGSRQNQIESDEFIYSLIIENFETFHDLLIQRGSTGGGLISAPLSASLSAPLSGSLSAPLSAHLSAHLSASPVSFTITAPIPPPFGRIRLEIVEMFSEIISSIPNAKNSNKIIEKLKSSKIIPIFINFFFLYKENNLLHEKVVKIIQTIFQENWTAEQLFLPIIEQILKDCQIRKLIIQGQKENDAHVQRPRGNRLPFMGHLTLIAESIIKWETSRNQQQQVTTCMFLVSDITEESRGEPPLRESLREPCGESLRESWREYSNKTFKETRLKDKKVLGGIKPPISLNEIFSSSEDDSGDELLNYNSIFRSGDEEQLARYFCQQIIGNLPEHFLYTEEEGNRNGNRNRDYEDSDSESESESDSSDYNSDDSDDFDDFELIFDSRKSSRRKFKIISNSVKSIEIPILMPQDDFDEDMFDESFTSSLLSDDSEEDDEGGYSDSDDNDDNDDNAMY